MLHEALWEANRDLARSCLAHPFVQALGDGSLEVDLFRGYIAQDAFFLRAFVKAYALALARAEDAESLAAFSELIAGALEELRLHGSYATELRIDLERLTPAPACRAYTDFLLRTAWHTTLAETLAAMTPCMRLYAYLGGELAGKGNPRHPYRRWIAAYSDPEFARLASRIEALLDRFASDAPHIRQAYRYAMRCEFEFFSDAMKRPL